MTEKRFIVIDDGFDFMVRDTFTGDDLIDADGVADALNDYEKENKQLKEQLEICKDARQAYKQDWKACVSYCDTYKDEIHTLKDNIQGLIEENNELKSLCKVLIKHIEKNSIAFVIDEDIRRLLE